MCKLGLHMLWRDMPSLSGLRAFAAYVETGTVAAAGAALNVSHAAVSQQMRSLEQHLGVPLLDRTGRALALTPQGAQLADAVTLGFGAISRALDDITGADADRPLHVSATPTFTGAWLMPRLADFRATYPKINLLLDPSPFLVELEPGGIDIAIRYGDGDWPGLNTEPLLQSPMVVMAAPSLIGDREIKEPADLADLPWLEELGLSEAKRWLESKGVELGLTQGQTQLPGNLILDAARDGHGVVVAVRTFVENDLQAGRLVALFEEPRQSGYFIVTRPGALRPAAKSFMSWLRSQRE